MFERRSAASNTHPLNFIDEIISELGSMEAGLVESGAPSAAVEGAAELLDRWNRARGFNERA